MSAEKFNLTISNENISNLCDLIEVLRALNQLWPGYVMDPADLDQEGCFV